MKSTRTLLRFAVAALLVTAAVPTHAILLDHGPADPVLAFPIWYRDLNNLPLKECLSQVASPNAGAAGKPFCFPANPDPTGFAGNVGPEIFYSDLNVALNGAGGMNVRYVAALEGSYLPAGVPIHGSESLFARLRITANITVAGTYKVTHPYGVELFNVTANNLGPRAIFWTADVPLGAILDYNTALSGRIGPFTQWDFVDPGLTLTNSAGEQFVGDPNFLHTFTGSPFGTNLVRIDGPVGSNLDGVGNDFLQTPLGNVLGQKYLAPIPTPTAVKRATYARTAAGLVSIDVWASSAPAQKMFLTGVGVPSIAMVDDAAGNYYGHVEIVGAAVAPAGVTITNTTSNPVVNVPVALIDLVNVTAVSYDSFTRALAVTATSSDLSAVGPALVVAGPLGGAMTAGAYTTTLLAGVLPPLKVSVTSAAGGTDTDDVVIIPDLAMNKPTAPVAVPDASTTNLNVAVTIPVSANDSVVAPATLAQVIVITPPTSGAAVPAAVLGSVTYTPSAGFSGVDTFQYVLVDSVGQVSNLATVTVTVAFVALGPTAVADDFATVRNSSRAVNVLANDTAAAGTTINPASIVITTAPLHGLAVPNANGTVTYTPVQAYIGPDAYAYTVKNNAGIASNPATVNIVVEGAGEALAIQSAIFTVARSSWKIVGSTSWFGPTLLTTTVTCYNGPNTAGAVLGTAPIDITGKFALVPPVLTTPPPLATNIFTCQTSNGGTISAVVQRK